MNDALVIGRHGQGAWFIHSDHVAARMMQKTIAQGEGPVQVRRGEGVTELRMERAERREAERAERIDGQEARRSERIEAREDRRADRIEGRADMREVDGLRAAEAVAPVRDISGIEAAEQIAASPIGGGNRDTLASLREKVAEMTRALESLSKAMEAMGDFKLLIAEGDSASVVAFAGQVLADMRNDAEAKLATDDAELAEVSEAVEPAAAADAETEAEVIEPEMAQGNGDDAGGDDTFDLSGDMVSEIYGGAGNDTMTIMAAMSAQNIYGGTGDDVITVTGKHISGIYGDSGDDIIIAKGDAIQDVSSGSGDDRVEVTAPHVGEVSGGQGDDVVTVTARTVDGVVMGAGEDVFDLQVASANLHLTRGMGRDVVNLRDGAHIEVMVADPEAMMRDGLDSGWDGNDLAIEFSDGSRLLLENAANAGSLTLRAGDEVFQLKQGDPNEIPPMLDAIV